MALTANEAWENGKRTILADGEVGVGIGSLVGAMKAGVQTGGFTALRTGQLLDRYQLRAVQEIQQARRQNILRSDKVIILADDPRLESAGWLITATKERHRPLWIVLDHTMPVDALVKWIDKDDIIHVCGTMTFVMAEVFTRNLCEAWIKGR